MSDYPIQAGETEFYTLEALFQWLRFDDDHDEIREEIRLQTSPMSAKMKAKRYKGEMDVVPMSEEDVDNMRWCLEIKLKQHPELVKELLATGDEQIIEDCSKRASTSGKFWGAALIDGEWIGENMLGILWMELREKLRTMASSESV